MGLRLAAGAPPWNEIKTYTMAFPSFRLLQFREIHFSCPRIMRVTSSEKVRGPIWGIPSLVLIISWFRLISSGLIQQKDHFRVALRLSFPTSLRAQHLSYKKEFDLYEKKSVGGTHFYMNGFARDSFWPRGKKQLGNDLFTSLLQPFRDRDKFRDKFRQLPERSFTKHVHDLLLLIKEAEDNYVETPILTYKIANFT